MIGTVLGVVPIVVIYLLIGVVATAVTGGRDPLSFGPPKMIVLWPIAAFVALVGTAIMLVASQ